MKNWIIAFSICIQPIFLFGQVFDIDSFAQDSFVLHLLENTLYNEANALLDQTISYKKESSDRVIIKVKWAAITNQPSLVNKINNSDLLAIENQSARAAILKSLIEIDRPRRAQNLCYTWSFDLFKPPLKLFNGELENYEDSFYGIYPTLDTIFLNIRKDQTKGNRAALISIIPGAGKLYLGRAFDGLGTLSIISMLTIQGYEQRRNDALLQYPYFLFAGMFYVSSIYGTNRLKKEIAETNKKLRKERLLLFIHHI